MSYIANVFKNFKNDVNSEGLVLKLENFVGVDICDVGIYII